MHLLARNRAVGKDQARPNVLRFEERVLLQDSPLGIPGGEHAQNVFNGDAHVSDNRFAAEDIRARGDALEQFLFSRHGAFVLISVQTAQAPIVKSRIGNPRNLP